MSKFARGVGALAVLLATTVIGALPASAASSSPSPSAGATASTGYACLDQKAGYQAAGVCQLTVLEAQTVCRGNVPWLDYALKPDGTPNTTTTLVWGDENGTHVTMADLPLTGSVMWPGVVLDAKGNAIDWPGWTLVNGVWVEHDEWDWVRPHVQLTFHVNPTATVTANYPETTALCANPPRTAVLAADDPTPTTTSAVLAATGSSDAEPLVLATAGILLLGSLLLGLRAMLRRRASTR